MSKIKPKRSKSKPDQLGDNKYFNDDDDGSKVDKECAFLFLALEQVEEHDFLATAKVEKKKKVLTFKGKR